VGVVNSIIMYLANTYSFQHGGTFVSVCLCVGLYGSFIESSVT